MGMSASYDMEIDKVVDSIDFDKLEKSLNSDDTEYAEEVLDKLHVVCKQAYGTNYLSPDWNFVSIPAVIRGKNTGYVGLGFVYLDLESSGEHWSTRFITKYRSNTQQGAYTRFVQKNFVPYEYWYTMNIPCDHHVRFDTMTGNVAKIMRKYHMAR